MSTESATDQRIRDVLAMVAPGTALRDGLERILRGRTGGLIVLGEDGSLDRRLAEAGRLGFTDVIAPARALRARGGAASLPTGMRMHEVSSVQEAIRTAQQLSRAAARPSSEGAS